MSRSTDRKWLVSLTAGAAMVMALSGQAAVLPAGPAAAAPPTSATDAARVPHYFGPWPNWANSPLTLPTAAVTISDGGAGTGATAAAQVDPVTGGISSIDVTAPGH